MLRKFALPLTDGPASVFGVPAKHAAELLFEEFNVAGGIGGVKTDSGLSRDASPASRGLLVA